MGIVFKPKKEGLNVMDIVGKEVCHKKVKLGIGIVVDMTDNNEIIVNFESRSMKMPYPNAFKEHLVFTDSNLQNEILAEISKKEAAKAKMAADRRKTAEEARRRENTIAKRKPVKKSMRPCIAFKLNYCDGGEDGVYAGFFGICSEKMIKLNIKMNKSWCTDSMCSCNLFIKGKITEKDLLDTWSEEYLDTYPCMDSVALRDWSVESSPGTMIRSAEPGHLCVFTTQFPTNDYNSLIKDRVVVGISIIDSIEQGNNDNSRVYSVIDEDYLLLFNIDEAKNFKYWDIAHVSSNPNDLWGSGLFRNFDDEMAIDFLKKAIGIKQDKEGKEHARKFLEHYCDINGLDANL